MGQRYRILFIIGFFWFSTAARGQSGSDILLSGDFSGLTFSQVVERLEASSPYRFFYRQQDVDSLRINQRFEQQTLLTILSQLFSGTNLQAAVDGNRQVFITVDRSIRTELPIGFFNQEGRGQTVVDSAAIDYLSGKEKRLAALETKLVEIGVRTNPVRTGNANLAGHIRDSKSGEPVIGMAVYIDKPRIGVVTDQFGYYSITIPRGRHELRVRGIGMKDTKRPILLYSDGKLDIEMEEDVIPLREVVIEAEKDVNVSGLQMGLERIDIKTMRQVPTVFGETDLFKVVQTLPGVKTVGESASGLNVRGGSTDQNLILFNDATIYNPTHLFGFFSAFNPDMIKNVELYKSGIPSRLGGRLSSVLEVQTRDGNKKEFTGSGGIGLITGRLTLEGPLIKEKSSFIIGARTTYSDWLLRQLRSSTFRNSQAAFYDINLHITHDFNEKNSLYLTGYYSRDRFQLNSDTAYRYQNQNVVLKWKHIFSNKLYSVFTGAYNRYQYTIGSDGNPINAYRLAFAVNQTNVKADFNYFPTSRHAVDFGASSIFYRLHPGSYQPLGAESLVLPDVVASEQGLENAVYIGDRFDVNPRLSINFGLRYSLYTYLGPQDVYGYPPGLPREENNITDTVFYGRGKPIATYHGPEYRISARYALSADASIKLSFNRMRQYIHMLSNTTAISPTDIWKLSDAHIRPQVGDQFSLGLYKNFKANTIETSVEGYYKTMRNTLDYKSGATLLLNHHIETDVVNAEGVAYGVELMVKKLTGRVNGWVSYTYSRSLLRVRENQASEVINQGRFYPSNYDKPHDVTLIGNYRFNRRFSTSLNFTYSTGRPITLPLGKYGMIGSTRVYYSERNLYRIPDYYRVDFSMNIEGNHRVRKLAHSSWTLAVYNLTGRRNAYSVYFNAVNGSVKGYQLSIFGQPIPTITYNFKF